MPLISDDLAAQGWSVQLDYFPPDLIGELLRDLEEQQERMKPAGIGRGAQNQVQEHIRNDKTLWLEGERAAQNEYLRLMDALRMDLNRDLFLGLTEFEAHYARYETGGFYKKHLDALKGERNRVVSTITYLTPGWKESDQGQLVLYDGEDRELARILPAAGTLALFMSEDVPHEVLPPLRPRSSIAGWFRCRV
jgi:SM-20-related protein